MDNLIYSNGTNWLEFKEDAIDFGYFRGLSRVKIKTYYEQRVYTQQGLQRRAETYLKNSDYKPFDFNKLLQNNTQSTQLGNLKNARVFV